MSGIAVDSDGIHSGESEQDKTAVLSKLSSGVAAGFGNGSSSKPWICDYLGGDDFEKGSNPIYDSVLDRAHPDIIGMHPCTAVNHLFFSSFQFWIATPDSLSLPVGVADVGGINRSPSDSYTSQTFTCTNGNQTVITDSHSNHDLRV